MPLTTHPPSMRSARGIRDIEFPSVSRAMALGITFAIAGNVLISFALNLQKLAHARLEAARAGHGIGLGVADEEEGRGAGAGDSEVPRVEVQREMSLPPELEREAQVWNGSSLCESSLSPGPPYLETDPLVALPVTASAELLPSMPTYGALFPITPEGQANSSPRRWKASTAKGTGTGVARQIENQPPHHGSNHERQETEYLKSKLWYALRETGNFISYAFAPASVVAPLGTFALVANCLFAPLLLHERLRKRDLFGVVLAIIGAVTVVLSASANTSDTRLSPEKLLQAVSQHAFLIFSAIYVASASILMGFSEGSVGRRWVLVDVGLCALFGGFTVLSTKAISTLLTTSGLNMFRQWLTYPVLAVSGCGDGRALTNLATSTQVLVGTGIGQIRYLNRALMRFASKVVIPTQFVLFTLSAILGSAILYGDFRRAKFHQFVTFVYGCAATFAGVWIITWVPAPEEPSAGPNDLGGASDEETDLFASDGLPVGGGVGPKPGNVPILEPRRSTVSLVGISPPSASF
ncbi:magnesium transporter NIPA-domain-containing protein [Russula brevipes]|nr:magnesium transporter NIPA-domain-containing protein [Russula brevipes]